MNVHSDHTLLHFALQHVRARRAEADRNALLAAAGVRTGTSLAGARRALAGALGRAARLLAAVAEDLDPAVARSARPARS